MYDVVIIFNCLPLRVKDSNSFLNIRIPVHFINDTSQNILSEDWISLFISVSSETPTLLPQNNSLCVSPVIGIIDSTYLGKLAAIGLALSNSAVRIFPWLSSRFSLISSSSRICLLSHCTMVLARLICSLIRLSPPGTESIAISMIRLRNRDNHTAASPASSDRSPTWKDSRSKFCSTNWVISCS